ncbi:MAG: hypothetical protein LBV28_03675, partial [Puniceicoccales bacterium]|nr:hypothetical protein [Puniceicoccales bacterium]
MSKNTPQDNAPEATSAEGSSCGCDCGCTENAKCCALCPGEKTLAFWILRLWLGARALLTGLSKFETVEDVAPTVAAAAGTSPAEKYGVPSETAAAVTKLAETATAVAPTAPDAAAATAPAVADAAAAVATVATDAATTTAAAAAKVTTHLAHHGLPKGGAWTLESFSNLADWPSLGWLVMPKWALHLLDGTLG